MTFSTSSGERPNCSTSLFSIKDNANSFANPAISAAFAQPDAPETISASSRMRIGENAPCGQTVLRFKKLDVYRSSPRKARKRWMARTSPLNSSVKIAEDGQFSDSSSTPYGKRENKRFTFGFGASSSLIPWITATWEGTSGAYFESENNFVCGNDGMGLMRINPAGKTTGTAIKQWHQKKGEKGLRMRKGIDKKEKNKKKAKIW